MWKSPKILLLVFWRQNSNIFAFAESFLRSDFEISRHLLLFWFTNFAPFSSWLLPKLGTSSTHNMDNYPFWARNVAKWDFLRWFSNTVLRILVVGFRLCFVCNFGNKFGSKEKQCVQNADSITIPARQNYCYCEREEEAAEESRKKSCEKGPFILLLQHGQWWSHLTVADSLVFLLLPLPKYLLCFLLLQKTSVMTTSTFKESCLQQAFREIEMCKK